MNSDQAYKLLKERYQYLNACLGQPIPSKEQIAQEAREMVLRPPEEYED